METKFKYGRFDRRSRNITLTIIIAVAAGFGAMVYFGSGGYLPAWFLSLAGAIGLLYVLSIPRHITVTDSDIQIHCVLELTTIPLRDVRSIRKLSRRRVRYVLPVLGSYGFFGYYGYYFNLRSWELVKVYARQWGNFVEIVDIYEQAYIVSCPDADRLIAAVRENKRAL